MMNDFNGFGFDEYIIEKCIEKGWDKPTKVQERIFRLFNRKCDLITYSDTGSGKTAAYVLPIVNYMINFESNNCALILVPTRELTYQISKYFQHFRNNTNVLTLTGNDDIKDQVEQAKSNNFDIIIATPGRLKNILQLKKSRLNLSNIRYLIIDECDKLLSSLYINDLKEIKNYLPSDRITAMFSATKIKNLDTLKGFIKKHHETIDFIREVKVVSDIEYHLNTPMDPQISQMMGRLYVDINYCLKNMQPKQKMIVFVNTKKYMRIIKELFDKHGINTLVFSGELNGEERKELHSKFTKNKDVRVLIATDLASRGVHFSNIGCVLNFQLPANYETYVHRCGRSARAGNKGFVVNCLDYKDWDQCLRFIIHDNAEKWKFTEELVSCRQALLHSKQFTNDIRKIEQKIKDENLDQREFENRKRKNTSKSNTNNKKRKYN